MLYIYVRYKPEFSSEQANSSHAPNFFRVNLWPLKSPMSLLLDPILVSTEMGRDQKHGPRQAEVHNENQARRRSRRGRIDRVTRSWDRGATTGISESTYYKERRRNTEDDTLKTQKRATHFHWSCCLPTFKFFLYRSPLYHSISFNSLYSILLSIKFFFETVSSGWMN